MLYLGLLILLSISSISSEGCDTQCLQLGSDDFQSTLQNHPNLLVSFYNPQCDDCIALEKVFVEIAEQLAKQQSFIKLAKVDCTTHQSLCKKYNVDFYPTIYWFSGDAEPILYPGQKTKEQIISWLTTTLRTSVYQLTVSNFDSILSQYDFVFVKFFAPWCGHCVRLAPAWVDLAKSNENQQILIAQVDCVKHKQLCSKNKVSGYPTLKLFSKNKQPIQYQEARTLQAFNAWLQKQTAPPAPETPTTETQAEQTQTEQQPVVAEEL